MSTIVRYNVTGTISVRDIMDVCLPHKNNCAVEAENILRDLLVISRDESELNTQCVLDIIINWLLRMAADSGGDITARDATNPYRSAYAKNLFVNGFNDDVANLIDDVIDRITDASIDIIQRHVGIEEATTIPCTPYEGFKLNEYHLASWDQDVVDTVSSNNMAIQNINEYRCTIEAFMCYLWETNFLEDVYCNLSEILAGQHIEPLFNGHTLYFKLNHTYGGIYEYIIMWEVEYTL